MPQSGGAPGYSRGPGSLAQADETDPHGTRRIPARGNRVVRGAGFSRGCFGLNDRKAGHRCHRCLLWKSLGPQLRHADAPTEPVSAYPHAQSFFCDVSGSAAASPGVTVVFRAHAPAPHPRRGSHPLLSDVGRQPSCLQRQYLDGA